MRTMTASIEVKPWGETWLVAREPPERPTFEMWELRIKPGGFCSIHFHRRKRQFLFVASGILRMRLFNGAGRLRQETDFRAGAAIFNDVNERHQFQAMTDVLAFEVYQDVNQIDPEDIIRLSEGGCG